MRPPVLAVKRKQIERKEAWWAAMEHEIVESWLAPAIHGDDLTVKDRVGR
jgi:hypothetical protein